MDLPSAIGKAITREALVQLLGAPAHNVLLWTKEWLSATAPKLKEYGTLQFVRDVFSAAGRVKTKAEGEIQKTVIKRAMPFADAILAGVETIQVEVVDYAERGDRLYIFWNASRVADGKQLSWHGVDRFRIENGMAIEEQVIFDTQVLQG